VEFRKSYSAAVWFNRCCLAARYSLSSSSFSVQRNSSL